MCQVLYHTGNEQESSKVEEVWNRVLKHFGRARFVKTKKQFKNTNPAVFGLRFFQRCPA